MTTNRQNGFHADSDGYSTAVAIALATSEMASVSVIHHYLFRSGCD